MPELVEPLFDVEEVVDLVAWPAVAYDETVVDVRQIGTDRYFVALIVGIDMSDILANGQIRDFVLLV